MSDPEIRHAMQLIGIEVERANSPNDESEAVCELLRRSHENPDLKKGMLFMCALNVIREGREKRVWLKSFENCFLIHSVQKTDRVNCPATPEIDSQSLVFVLCAR